MSLRNARPSLLVIAALAAPGSALALPTPASRIDRLLGSSELGGRLMPVLDEVPPPPAPPPASAPLPPDSVVPADLYATLPAPDAATLAKLAARVPGLDTSAVRTLPENAIDAMLAAAVARGQSPLDFFTDPAFRGRTIYYLAPDVIAAVFARYEIRVMTPPSGKSTDGKPYAMQALLMGGGKIETLYDLDGFKTENPMFPGFTYKFSSRVTETILGPADMRIEGAWVRHGIVTPKITRVVKISPAEGRVETNYGDRVKPVYPLKRRER